MNRNRSPKHDPNRKPLVVAHRGASAEAPENTLAAFRLALEQGCDAIELDIHLSADEKIIVVHDATLERTTSGTGAVAELTADELREFDAGGWFGPAFASERLPLLDEVLDLVPPEIQLNVEVKGYAHPNINRRLVELLERRNRMDSVFVSSFGLPELAELKKRAPSLRIGLLYDVDEAFDYADFFSRQGITGFSLHPYHGFVKPGYIEKASEHGLEVYPWTVDDPVRMKELAKAGAAGIITNRPLVLRELLAQKED